MKTISLTRLLLAAAALAIAGPTLAAACQDVTFTVINSHSTGKSIKIKKVKYRDITSNKNGITENVVDITCGFGKACTTLGDDLGDLAAPRLGHNLTNFQFQYQYKEADGDWSTALWSPKLVPNDTECRNDRDYGSAAGWTIN